MEIPKGNRASVENRDIEGTEKLRGISQDFARIFEIKDAGILSKNLDQATEAWQSLKSRDGAERVEQDLDWYDRNNHRINLYQIADLHSDEWDNEETTPVKNEHLLALKRLDVCLKQFTETTEPALAIQRLEQVARSGQLPEHSVETAIDSMARLGTDGGLALERLMDDERTPLHQRLRAALSALRYGQPSSSFDEKAKAALFQSIESDDAQALMSAIELCGLMGGSEGREALKKVGKKLKTIPTDQRRWLERDLFSTQLAIDPDSMESIRAALEGRAWKAPAGIVFGSLAPMDGFDKFIADSRVKLEQLAEALKRTNDAFGSEPVLYVDIIPDDPKEVANEGWTQNSIHLSKSLIEHPRISAKTTIQGAIHEACERWESKGFVDAGMEADYVRLLGDDYESSVLDKFSLRHRYDISSRAGHPWDGTREYMAEAGSILLAEPGAREKLLDEAKDHVAWQALDYVRDRIQKHAAHMKKRPV